MAAVNYNPRTQAKGIAGLRPSGVFGPLKGLPALRRQSSAAELPLDRVIAGRGVERCRRMNRHTVSLVAGLAPTAALLYVMLTASTRTASRRTKAGPVRDEP